MSCRRRRFPRAGERSSIPALRIVELSDNLGFAHAANLGVETAMESGAVWILLLNDDAVVEPSCLASCVQSKT